VISHERRYVEDFATVMTRMGLAPSHAKVLGWLLICDPPSQSVSEIAAALGMSKGSVSTGARLLENAGVIGRVAVPGRRGTFYEMRPDAMVQVSGDSARFRAFREVLDRGLAVLGDQAGKRAERIQVTRDFYAFVEKEMADIVERFKRSR
jgi:DNA-binding transcriptional regulator GbsR (MarR family)